MRATEDLAKRHRENPLGPNGDRVLALFEALPKLHDPQFEAVRSSSNLVASETNNRLPNAKTFHYPDGSHLITIYTGLIDFYISVCKIVMGATNLYTNRGTFPAQLKNNGVAELEELFRRWTPKGLEEDKPSGVTQTDVAAEKAEETALLLGGALRFVLCHELGHVLYYGTKHRKLDAAGLTVQQEFASDIVGMQTATTSMGYGPYSRVNLAGCVLSLRVLAIFADMGHSFTGDHPSPIARLDNVFATLRSWCVTPADYWSLTPIAYAYDEMLETAGQRALGGPEKLPVRADRAFIRMVAMMEEALKKTKEEADIVSQMLPEFEEAGPEILEQIATYAAEVLGVVPVAMPEYDNGWAAKGELFRSLYHRWPKRVSDAFDNAFAAGQS